MFNSKKSPLNVQAPFALGSRGVYAISTQSAAATLVFIIHFFFVLYLSVGSLPPKRAVKKHNTKLKLSYIFGKLEAELAGRKRKSPVVCVSVFVVFFFYFVFSSPAISVVPPLPQSASQLTSQQLKLCLSLFFIGVFQYCCISIVVLM